MKNRVLYGILVFLLFPNVSGMAQIRVRENIQDGKTLIMLTPQYLRVDQLRIEIDRRIADRHWITLAPHYVQNFQQYQTHSGFGLVATYKFFFGTSSYLGGGLQFTHHTINNYARDEYINMDEVWLYKTDITQYGINAIVGRYVRLLPHLFGDIYGGFGYRYSETKSSDGINHFGKGLLSPNYTGLTLVLGVRIGIML
jgi:hypothetical protein